VPGVSQSILQAADAASYDADGQLYRLVWSRIIPLVVLALICVACLKSVKVKMTDHVEASVEHVRNQDKASLERTEKV
jgi:hypothetical protein